MGGTSTWCGLAVAEAGYVPDDDLIGAELVSIRSLTLTSWDDISWGIDCAAWRSTGRRWSGRARQHPLSAAYWRLCPEGLFTYQERQAGWCGHAMKELAPGAE